MILEDSLNFGFRMFYDSELLSVLTRDVLIAASEFLSAVGLTAPRSYELRQTIPTKGRAVLPLPDVWPPGTAG